MERKDFLVGQHRIDVERNQITVDGQTHSVTPKAMTVLCVLADHQGDVVSFERLMALVWPNTVVSTNTLQRNISQLRKVFGDDSQKQAVIKTHSKRGYSLELHIRDLTTECDHNTNNAASISTNLADDEAVSLTPMNLRWKAFVTSIVATLITAFVVFWPSADLGTDVVGITPITSTDALESNGSYDRKGTFVVFQRHIDNCRSHIWIKDVSTHREWQLTKDPGVYTKPSWSFDGNHIAFTQRNQCNTEALQEPMCWSVNTISVLDAATAPQAPTVRVDCQNHPAWLAKWLPDGRITYLLEEEGKPSIQVFDPKTTKSSMLFSSPDKYTYQYEYSPNKPIFAAVSVDNHHQHVLETFAMDGTLLSSADIQLPADFPTDTALNVQFNPTNDALLLSANSSIYKLEIDGSVTVLDNGGRNNLRDVSMHPSANSYLATEVTADTDNILITQPDMVKSDAILDLSAFTLSRSNRGDDYAKFQPNGQLIAFTSTRTGKRQIWLHSNGEVVQFTDLKSGVQTRQIAWSPDGQHLAAISANQVAVWSLDSKVEKLITEHKIEDILQWRNNSELLVNARTEGVLKLYRLNRHTGAMTDLRLSNVRWANESEKDGLIYLDDKGRVWQHNQTVALIKPLTNQLEQPVLTYNRGKLYGINHHRQVWSYSIAQQRFNTLATLPKSSRYISDYNGEAFLITVMTQLKKDLIAIHIQ